MGGLHLGVHVVLGCAGNMRALAWMAPGAAVETIVEGNPHQLMIGRMEVHFVDAVAETVMGVEDRFVGVGAKPQVNGLRGPGQGSECLEVLGSFTGALPEGSFLQGNVLFEQVIVLQGRWLVEDLVGAGQVAIFLVV